MQEKKMKSWQSKELKCCWNAVKRNYASGKNDVYKRETALSVVALAFLLFVIIPQVLECGWASPALRSMMFTLFGIVGLMGFSISIKRHEEDRSRNAQALVEHKAREKAGQIERMHSCIQELTYDSPFAVFLGALHELETIFEKLSFENKKLLLRIICFFIQSDRIRMHTSDCSQESFAQEARINFAFKTLKELSNGKPIEVLKENQFLSLVRLSFMTFEGESMKLEGEDLTGCDWEGTSFYDASIIDCKIGGELCLSPSDFRNVRIDKSDLGGTLVNMSSESFASMMGYLETMDPKNDFIYFTEAEPTNILLGEPYKTKFLRLLRYEK
jgi:uncharacterized protein YjbI with pentapeptide repeats